MKSRMLLSLFITLPATLWAGNVLDKTGNPSATAVVAYSVRQLSSAYTGKAMNVLRSSDNTSMDIGFTPNGDLDTATLKTFVGTGTGYVTTWYDQSGNGLNAVQPTAALQPTIVTAGVINRDNGQPSVYTNGTTGFLYFQPVTGITSTVTRMEVCRSRDLGGLAITEGLGHYQLDLELFPTNLWVQYQTGNITAPSTTVTTTSSLMSINSVRNSGNSLFYVNTILQGANTTTLGSIFTPDSGYIGVRWDYELGATGQGAFSETMLFASVLSDADRQSINYNENWYYSLGFDPCSSTQAALSDSGTTEKALYACTQTPAYAYYYDPAHPLDQLFGIAKDPNSTGANPAFNADSINLTVTSSPSSVVYSATSGQEGIFALGRYWNVYTHTPLTSPVNVRFFFNPTDTMAALDAALAFKSSSGAALISSLQWFKTVGGPFNQDSLTATPTATIKGPFLNLTPIYGTMPNGLNYAEFDGVPSFSGGTGVYIVSNTFTILPLVTTSFAARRVNETSVLTWTTASESNMDRFEINRSTDGSSWTKIGQVPAAGNSSTPSNYLYIDTVPLPAGNSLYYRLTIVTKNGQRSYSAIISVAAGTGQAPSLLDIVPNPLGNTMEVKCTVPNNGPVEVQFLDITGAALIRQKYTANKGNNIFTLTNLGDVAPGVYIVRVVQSGVTIGIVKALKR
jgi:hypothetical protein